MWVWQSQAPAGTSKLTRVAGWDALAKPVRRCMAAPAASAPIRTSRRVSMGFSSGGILSVASRFRYIVSPQTEGGFMHLFARRTLAAALLVFASTSAWAQGYQDRPLRLVVGFPPGGSGDFLARIIADELTREIGQPVVVDNKPGAGSNIATEHVARAAADGYTILLAGNFTHAINPWLYRNLAWDPHRDFTPITKVALMSIIVCVAPQRGIRSMKELIAKVKSEPGKWFYASPGNGTSQHLAGAELNRLAGMDMQHVPFNGGAPSLQAVLASDAQVMIGTSPVVMPQTRAGKLGPVALNERA